MKNLKKVLSLSLALVMLLGMMIMPQANAAGMTYADLVDKDDITNLPEVALLVDLGIIEGKTGGVYDPTGIVDRATMAKLVTTLHFGAADANQFLGATSDLIDIKGNWAEGYILYCYTQGIIAGDGMGKFFPSNEVTVAEAAKMLLVTLGYDPIKAGLVGADWAVNTISTATKAGILSGVTLRSSDKVDRDSIALMMYNTLFAQQVAYNSLFGNEPISKNNSLGLATYGLVKVEGLVTAANKDNVTFNISDTVPAGMYASAAGVYNTAQIFNLGGQQAYVGKNAAIYLKFTTRTDGTGGNFLAASVAPDKLSKIYSSELTEIPGGVLAVSHNGTAWAKLIDRADTKFVAALEADITTVSFFLNERASTEAAVIAAVADKAVGVVVTFIDNDGNGRAEIVQVIQYTAAKVVSYSTATKGKVSFSNGNYGGASDKWTGDNVTGFADLAKDDIVYGYVTGDGSLKVFVAESAEGKVNNTTFASAKITVDGTSYTGSSRLFNSDYLINTAQVFTGALVAGDEAKVFLDSNNYIIFAEKLEGAAKDILLIKAVGGFAYDQQGAEVVFADGTSKRIQIAKISTSATTPAVAITSGTILKNQVYAYTVNSKDEYTVYVETGTTTATAQVVFGGSFVAPSPNTTTLEYVEITKGIAGAKFTAAATGAMTGTIAGFTTTPNAGDLAFSANAATIYVDVESGKTYTGHQNVPNTKTEGVVWSKVGDFAQIVFLVDGSMSDASTDKVFVYGAAVTTTDNGTDKYYSRAAIINGVVGTVYYKDLAVNAGSYYAMSGFTTIDGNTVYTKGTETVFPAATPLFVQSLKSNVMVVDIAATGSPKAWTVNDATIYIRYDGSSTAIIDSSAVNADVDLGSGAKKDNVVVIAAGTSGANAETAAYVIVGTQAQATPKYTMTLTTPADVSIAVAGTDAKTVAVGGYGTGATLATIADMTVTSSDTAVATVAGAGTATITVTGVAAGTTTITVSYHGVVLTYTVTVA